MGTPSRLLSTITDGLFAEFWLRRQIRKAARVELSSLDENTFAGITGTVRPFDNRLLEAPVSARLCVYYSLTVTWRRSLRQDIMLGSEVDGITFLVDDETATAVVDPAGAKTSVVFDVERESKAEGVHHPLFERWWIPEDRIDRGSLVYREAIISPGTKIAVFGAGMREPDLDAPPTGMYRDSGAQRLRFTGTERFPLLITNDPKTLRP